MSIVKDKSRAELKTKIMEEFRALRNKFNEHNITLARENWQPIVISERHLNQQELSHFFNECRHFPELNLNVAIEHFSYSRYFHDMRSERGLFAHIPPMKNDSGLYVFFPRSYTGSSLTKEFMNIETVCFY